MVDTVLGDITGKKKKKGEVYDPYAGNADLSAAEPAPAALPKGMGVMATLAFNKSNGIGMGSGSNAPAIGMGSMGVGLNSKATTAAKAATTAEDTNVNIRKELGLDTILSNKKRARDKTTKTTALGA